MKPSRDFYPVVFVVSALLIIFIVLIMVYLLGRISPEYSDEATPEPSEVGFQSEPDSLGWRPLFNMVTLDGWIVTNFGPQGPVVVRDSSIILNFGDGATGITWQRDFPVIDYEISLEAKRIDGNDFFCGLTFPVGEEHCSFIIGGWGGSLVGLSSIDGEDASENFTSTRKRFEEDTWYNILITVNEQAITGYIDNEMVFNVPVQEHSFSVRSELGLSRPLGIASWVTTAALRNIRFREI